MLKDTDMKVNLLTNPQNNKGGEKVRIANRISQIQKAGNTSRIATNHNCKSDVNRPTGKIKYGKQSNLQILVKPICFIRQEKQLLLLRK